MLAKQFLKNLSAVVVKFIVLNLLLLLWQLVLSTKEHAHYMLHETGRVTTKMISILNAGDCSLYDICALLLKSLCM